MAISSSTPDAPPVWLEGTDDDKHLSEADPCGSIADESLIVEEKIDGTKRRPSLFGRGEMVLAMPRAPHHRGMHPQLTTWFKQWATVKRYAWNNGSKPLPVGSVNGSTLGTRCFIAS